MEPWATIVRESENAEVGETGVVIYVACLIGTNVMIVRKNLKPGDFRLP